MSEAMYYWPKEWYEYSKDFRVKYFVACMNKVYRIPNIKSYALYETIGTGFTSMGEK